MRRSSITTVLRGRAPSASRTVASSRTSLGTGAALSWAPDAAPVPFSDTEGTIVTRTRRPRWRVPDRPFDLACRRADDPRRWTTPCSARARCGTGISFRERVAAAEAGGFSGMSLWGRDYQVARDEGPERPGHPPAAGRPRPVGRRARPCLVVAPRARPRSTFRPSTTHERIFRFGEPELFAVADAVGARSLNAVDVFGGPWSLDEAAAAFAGLCDRAAEHGLLVHLEFLPWSRIPDLATAWQVVDAADRPNGGIMLDAWHYFRERPRRRAAALHSGRVHPRRPAVRRAGGARSRIRSTPRCTNGCCRATASLPCPPCWPTSRRPARRRRSGSRCSPTCSMRCPRRRRDAGPAPRCASARVPMGSASDSPRQDGAQARAT